MKMNISERFFSTFPCLGWPAWFTLQYNDNVRDKHDYFLKGIFNYQNS